MKYSVNISKDAKEDLKGIYKYIAFELLSPDTALKQLDKIEKAILSLDNLPARHRLYDEYISKDIRFLPVNNYVVFYIVDEKNMEVHIVRVLYGGRNMENIL